MLVFKLLYVTSVFCPRVRARALRAPVFFSSLPRQTGRCAPLPPAPASLLLIQPPKIYKIYRIWVADVKDFFLSTLPPRPERVGQAFYPVVRIGSLHPLTPKRLLFPPPLDPGGRHTHFRRGWGESIPTMGHTL
jgi:hypothetical protein